MVKAARSLLAFTVATLALLAALEACSGTNEASDGVATETVDGGVVTGADASLAAIPPSDAATLVPTDGCVNLGCQQRTCGDGGTTSVSGTVYAPNGLLPLYNAIVYIPNAPLAPIDAGLSCDQCGTLASGSPLTTTVSDSSGHFVLSNVPVGVDIPLVVQIGKWRRQTTLPAVPGCVDTPITDPNLTRLPRNQQEGNMPHIALTTGSCDDIGCLLAKVGIDPSEFGAQGDGPSKAVHVYSSTSNGLDDGFTNTLPAATLWRTPALLATYDIGVFSCECTEAPDTKGTYGDPSFQAVTDYLNSGGRIFTTDYQYVWYRYSPDPNLGAMSSSDLDDTGIGVITGSIGNDANPLLLDETFPKGLALGQWLTHVFPANPLVDPDGGAVDADVAADNGSGVTCDAVYDHLSSVTAPAQTWATASSGGGDFDPQVFTVNTPVGVPTAQQCGKGVHIDAHLTYETNGESDFVGCNGDPGPVGSAGCYPFTCTNPLKEDEAMFAFFFFDLASCIQDEAAPIQPPR